MQKKSLLALLLAAMLLLSGCALVAVDQNADNARIIVDVNGETINKATINASVNYQINQNQQMNELYAMFGMQPAFATDEATLRPQIIQAHVENLVALQKAKALGHDQMTEEDKAAIEAAADESYASYLEQVAQAYLADSQLEGDALTAAAEEYAKTNGLAGREAFVEDATTQKTLEKLFQDTVKDIAVTEEELSTTLTQRAESAKAGYEATPDQFGSEVNDGATVYYAPAGYRMVKQILVKFTEDDAKTITEKTAAQTAAQTALTEAQTALTNAAADADKTALQAAVDAAQKTLEEADAALTAAQEAAAQNIQAKADEVYAKATAEGADFDALVAEFNEDTGMPAAGYAIRQGYAYFVPSFVEAGMALEKVGDVCQPTLSSHGYHILQYTAEVTEGTVALDTVRAELEAELLQTKQDAAYTEAMASWVSEASVKTYPERMN